MSLKLLKPWINPFLVGLLILFSALKTSGTSANIGKFVEFFLSNPA